MRTGTKFAGFALFWGLGMASLVLVAMIYLTWLNPDYKILWQYVPAIITALIGQGVLNFASNEVRKAVEWWATKKAEKEEEKPPSWGKSEPQNAPGGDEGGVLR